MAARRGDDRVKGSNVADRVRGGPGDDVLDLRGGRSDIVNCGPGKDVAVVDRHDVVHGCEHVRRSQPGAPGEIHTLKISVSGPGTIKGPGIDCPGDCSGSFADGKTVALTSTPDAGAELSGWQGSCAGGQPTCNVTMTSRTIAGADFRSTGSENPPGHGTCEVDPTTMTAPGCTTLRSDTSAGAPRAGLWGSVDCASSSRASTPSSGGDPSPQADGTRQPDSAFRDLTVLDGDDVWGERCELGHNERRYGVNTGSQTSGTFELYHAGDHKITFFSGAIRVTSTPASATGRR